MIGVLCLILQAVMIYFGYRLLKSARAMRKGSDEFWRGKVEEYLSMDRRRSQLYNEEKARLKEQWKDLDNKMKAYGEERAAFELQKRRACDESEN